MTTKAFQRRLDALEAARQPPGQIIVCWCSLPDGQHEPDCDAPAAGLRDTVLLVRWEEDGELVPRRETRRGENERTL